MSHHHNHHGGPDHQDKRDFWVLMAFLALMGVWMVMLYWPFYATHHRPMVDVVISAPQVEAPISPSGVPEPEIVQPDVTQEPVPEPRPEMDNAQIEPEPDSAAPEIMPQPDVVIVPAPEAAPDPAPEATPDLDTIEPAPAVDIGNQHRQPRHHHHHAGRRHHHLHRPMPATPAPSCEPICRFFEGTARAAGYI